MREEFICRILHTPFFKPACLPTIRSTRACLFLLVLLQPMSLVILKILSDGYSICFVSESCWVELLSWRKPVFPALPTLRLVLQLIHVFTVGRLLLSFFPPYYVVCGILVPWPRIEPLSPAMEVWEPPPSLVFIFTYLIIFYQMPNIVSRRVIELKWIGFTHGHGYLSSCVRTAMWCIGYHWLGCWVFYVALLAFSITHLQNLPRCCLLSYKHLQEVCGNELACECKLGLYGACGYSKQIC